MRFGIASFILATCFAATSAQAINLNTTSVLNDEGIEMVTPPAKILDGIPLMDGLQEQTNSDVVKILPEFGSAPPVVTIGIVDVDDVYNFYKRALPPLGWKAADGRDYVKGTESLHIRAYAEGKSSTVTFSEDMAGQ